MKRTLILSFLWLTSIGVFAQEETDRLIKFLFDEEAIEPDYSSTETAIPFEKKKEILLSLGRQDFYNQQLTGEYKEDYASHYHFIDINNDGNLDILYNSADGADAPIFMIWLNNGSTYSRIIRQPGLLRYWNLEKKNFLIYEWAWIEETEGKLLHFQLQSERLALIERVNFPAALKLPTPLGYISEFETINDNYNLRSSPEIKNEPCEEYPDGTLYCGNIHEKLPTGTRGTAISNSTDETGRVWWLAKTSGKRGTIIGWVSSRFVTKK